jgi:macrolide transport system ATP-binding/permease protein
MKLLARLQSTLRNLFWKKETESELDSELRSFVDTVTEERVQSGMSPSEARRTAIAEFGGMEQVKQAVRDQRSGVWIQSFWRDMHYGLRQLARNPGFTLTVVATLALSIGANTAVFSLVNALMLKRLPYERPERLGTIFRDVEGPKPDHGPHQITGEQWELLRENVPSLLSAVSSGRADGVNLESGSHIEYVHAGRISSHYLEVFGIRPVLGRNFSDVEDRPHGPKAAILSYPLWRTIFGGDLRLIGQTIDLKGESYTVIGVLPAGAVTPLDGDLYTALQPSRSGEGVGSNYAVTVRLHDGATWQQADSEINRAWRGWGSRLAQYLGPGTHVSFHVIPLQRGETFTLRPQVLALMSAAGLILLIACANLAGLTLVRMAQRTPEMAARLALGGSHWQVQRQLWIENLLVALPGGAVGVLGGYLALRGLLTLLPEGYLPVAGVHLDGAVLAFTFGLSILTSLLFGMLPAWTVRKVSLCSSMATRSVAGKPGTRVRQVLIAGEVALTVVLLASSGLLIRTLIHLQTLPPGFNSHGVMAAKASLDDARYHDPAAFRKLLDESIAAMERIPGVDNAAMGLSLPYEPILNDTVTLADGKETGEEIATDMLYVTPGYFATLEIPILAGRAFTESDGPYAEPVAIVNQTFVRKFYGGANPVGRTFYKDAPKTKIVGVVADVPLTSSLDRVAPLQTEETVYIPGAQMTRPDVLALIHTWYQPAWVVRTAGPIDGLTGQMQRALASADPGLPFSGFYSMGDIQAQALTTQRLQVALLGTMAGLALLLSAVGIFSLVANSIAQRTREIGLRIALGSTLSRAMRHVAGIGIGPAAVGLLLGLLGSMGALPAMRGVLYGVGVYDVPSILGVVGILAGVAALATTMPALRIARIDPARTLREE